MPSSACSRAYLLFLELLLLSLTVVFGLFLTVDCFTNRPLMALRPRLPPLDFVVDGVGVLDRGPGVLGDQGDRCFDVLVQADGDRDIGAGSDRGTDGGVAVEGGVGAHQGPQVGLPDSLWAVCNASATRRSAPRGEPQQPLRSRWATITGAVSFVLAVAGSALSPRTPE